MYVHEGNTEEVNNGYVVSEWNIHGSAGKWGAEKEGEALLRPPPPLSTAVFSGQISKDDVNGFPSTSDICFIVRYFLQISNL